MPTEVFFDYPSVVEISVEPKISTVEVETSRTVVEVVQQTSPEVVEVHVPGVQGPAHIGDSSYPVYVGTEPPLNVKLLWLDTTGLGD